MYLELKVLYLGCYRFTTNSGISLLCAVGRERAGGKKIAGDNGGE